jgi:type II secretory pathway pseudopilin PulG
MKYKRRIRKPHYITTSKDIAVENGKLAALVRSNSSGGFVMLILLMTIVLVSITSTRIMLNASHEVQREQEAELIFRGEAIAKAIRAYKGSTGNYPLNLEDLLSIRPRIIRKLYKDPMTIADCNHKGDWDLILYAHNWGVENVKGYSQSSMPIVGVRSSCKKDSKKIYQGKDLLSDWLFVALDEKEMSELLSMD